MAKVELTQLAKSYRKDQWILRELNLEIADGEFVSLVGPSGCGKSTTLNLIAGLEEATQGTIHIDGQVVNDRSPGERDIAMVFQSYALYPHLSVRENVAFPLQIAKVARADIDQRVRETAARLGIEPLLTRKPKELSGGQRQRVALARALVRRPKVFLFDEPLSNLDAALRAQVRVELKKLHEELKATFVYVTHDQVEAMTLSTRIVVLQGGYVQQVGTPEDIYRRPANVFVAEFFGSPKINLFPAKALPGGAEGELWGVRPEDLEVGLGATPAGALPATVYLVEPMGSESYVTVEVAGTRATARAEPAFRAPSGAAAWVRWPPEKVLRFDAQSRVRKP